MIRTDKSSRERWRLCLLLAVGFLSGVAACAAERPAWFDPTRIDDAPILPAAISHHSGHFNGVEIEYDVIAGELLLRDDEGNPAATMFSTGYVRTDVDDPASRPVMFVFNGGPGASSSPLHLGIGPVRRPIDDPEGSLVPYQGSPLDTVDLVFVDPVGTGFTRLFDESAGDQFWGIESDADTVLHLVQAWLQARERTGAPVFIMGESYGGTRAAVMAHRAKEVELAGVFLLSPALDFSATTDIVGNNLPYVFRLPTMAATAAYHGVTDPQGKSYSDVFDNAAGFAQSEYAAALFAGNGISAKRKKSMAQEIARRTGIPVTEVLARNLRIGYADFMDLLLAGEGMRVGRLDARVKGLLAEYEDKRPPGNDPSMSSRPGGRSTGELLEEYFRDSLGVRLERPYRTLNLDLNQRWDYGNRASFSAYLSVAPQLQHALSAEDAPRVFVGGGIFDLATPIMAARYIMNQLDTPPEQFAFVGYEAGHSVFDHEESRAALCRDIRQFVRDTLAGQ